MPIILLKFWRELIIAILLVLWIGQLAYTGHLSDKHKDALVKIKAESIKKLAEKQNQINAISSELETEKQNIKIEFRDIKHETTKVVERPIYRDCKFDFAGLSIANKAIGTANTVKSDD